jgi:cardiolipin synthase
MRSRALQMQALSAERTIWIASAYFAPSLGMVEALAGAARDGVDVRVLVPSRYDHPWLRTIIAPFYTRLFKHGVRIWEWRGEMMHAKTNVVDGRWVRVGSTDFNLLGVAINFELDAVIEDATLGAQAEQMFLEDLDQAREIAGSALGALSTEARAPAGRVSAPAGARKWRGRAAPPASGTAPPQVVQERSRTSSGRVSAPRASGDHGVGVTATGRSPT